MLHFSVVFETQPPNIKRLAIIMVMRLRLRLATYFTWQANQPAIPHGIGYRRVGTVFLRISRPILPLLHFDVCSPLGIEPSLLLRTSLPPLALVLLVAFLAFIESPIGHPLVPIKSVYLFHGRTGNALFHGP